MSFALLLLGARRVGTAAITWLSHRSFWQLVCLALCAALLVQHLALRSERRHGDKVEAQLSKAVGELNRISTAKNEQKRETSDRIKVVTRTIREKEREAEKVEQAPLPGECQSPSEVLRADL